MHDAPTLHTAPTTTPTATPTGAGLDWTLTVDHFMTDMEFTRQASPHTLTAYRADLIILRTWLATVGVDLTAMRPRHATDYVQYLAKQHAEATVGRRVASARSFCRHLVGIEVLLTDPFAVVRKPKVDPMRNSDDYLSECDVEAIFGNLNRRIIAAMKRREHKAVAVLVRDRAILALMFTSGCRRAEVHGLSLDSFIQSGGSASIRVLGKGRKLRTLPLTTTTVEAISDWMDIRARLTAELPTPDAKALWINTSDGAMLSYSSFNDVFERVNQRVPLARPAHAHITRHTAATHIVHSSGNLIAAQQLLGHSIVSTTQIYVGRDDSGIRRALASSRAGDWVNTGGKAVRLVFAKARGVTAAVAVFAAGLLLDGLADGVQMLTEALAGGLV